MSIATPGPTSVPRNPRGGPDDVVYRACPYLIASAGTWRGSHPTRDHRCSATQPHAAPAIAKQRDLCLTPTHVSCATFVAAQEIEADRAGGRAGCRERPVAGDALDRAGPRAGARTFRRVPGLVAQGRRPGAPRWPDGPGIPGARHRADRAAVWAACAATWFGCLALGPAGGAAPTAPPTTPPVPSVAASGRPELRAARCLTVDIGGPGRVVTARHAHPPRVATPRHRTQPDPRRRDDLQGQVR